MAQAVGRIGPVPSLLDSRAVIFMQQRKHDQALEDLVKANETQPMALSLFHEALVQARKGDKAAAREAWVKAQEKGLAAAQLHPLERTLLEDLAAQLN
jgi:predicted negative regulator of RcsB-dependent stress response